MTYVRNLTNAFIGQFELHWSPFIFHCAVPWPCRGPDKLGAGWAAAGLPTQGATIGAVGEWYIWPPLEVLKGQCNQGNMSVFFNECLIDDG